MLTADQVKSIVKQELAPLMTELQKLTGPPSKPKKKLSIKDRKAEIRASIRKGLKSHA